MIYKSLAFTVGALSAISTNGFFVQPPRASSISTSTSLDMAAGLLIPINERTRALNKVKDLYGGRLDLGSMSDETEVSTANISVCPFCFSFVIVFYFLSPVG